MPIFPKIVLLAPKPVWLPLRHHSRHPRCLASLAELPRTSQPSLWLRGQSKNSRPLSTYFHKSSANPFFDTMTRPFYDHLFFFKLPQTPPWTTPQRHDILRLPSEKKPVPFLKDRGGISQDWCQKHEEKDLRPYQRLGRKNGGAPQPLICWENTSKYSMGLGLVHLPY